MKKNSRHDSESMSNMKELIHNTFRKDGWNKEKCDILTETIYKLFLITDPQQWREELIDIKSTLNHLDDHLIDLGTDYND